MADVQGLYTVAALVIATLAAWVILVLVRAPTAADESTPIAVGTLRAGSSSPAASETSHAELAASSETPSNSPADDAKAKRRARAAMAATVKTERTTIPDGAPSPAAPQADLDPPAPAATPAPAALPSVVLAPEIARVPTPAPAAVATAKRPVKTMLGIAAPSVPARTAAVAAASSQTKPDVPVVVLPPMRSRLDSHPEIQDSPANATVIVMPEASARRPPMVLVSAVGRSDPLPERSPETHAIVPRHHLFVFADGSGKKLGMELASSVATQALTLAFDQDEPTSFPDDPKLSARANRVRRAVLLANRSLLQRARTAGYAGLSANLFAAHFSPSNDELFVAHVGANRVYRVRAGELTRLTTPHGDRFVGMNTKVEVEVLTEAVEPQDLYLFCSDGLARAVGESELSSILGKDPSLEKTTAALILAVKGKDNTDNAVAMAVRVELARAGSG